MEDVVNISDYFKFLLALVFVIGLILLLAMLLRRLKDGFPSAMSKGRRLGIVETLPLDAKHRLVLIKRDDVEHLIIIGHNADSVIETGIIPPEEIVDIDEPNAKPAKTKPLTNTTSRRFKDMLTSMKSNQQ